MSANQIERIESKDEKSRKVEVTLTADGYRIVSALAAIEDMSVPEFIESCVSCELQTEGYIDTEIQEELLKLVKLPLFQSRATGTAK